MSSLKAVRGCRWAPLTAALLSGVLLAGCAVATSGSGTFAGATTTTASQADAGQSSATPTTATDPTDQGAPGSDTTRTDGWRGEHFGYKYVSDTETLIFVNVTNEEQTTRSGNFVITLTRYASGAEVTNTRAMASNIGPGQTVTISGVATIPLSNGLDMSEFFWGLQAVQG